MTHVHLWQVQSVAQHEGDKLVEAPTHVWPGFASVPQHRMQD